MIYLSSGEPNRPERNRDRSYSVLVYLRVAEQKQFDGDGNLLHKIDTRLSTSSYGEDELISLNQSLYIKHATSATSVANEGEEEAEWVEYKIKETNMFTVDKYQQIGFFPKERAFSLRYQTAGMLDTTLRQGVLGEDDTGEESPRFGLLHSL
ncbi:hypothetical protein DY000_02002736 [Brassica cretica]|uniref:DUF3598 domain-containing protein n=1 Tax=Brassica cretica TaxID=69181 RepID=A0ABQ7C885_BRACR|nr:hypothetical protein DY000_02002736 [Brassica cretica]